MREFKNMLKLFARNIFSLGINFKDLFNVIYLPKFLKQLVQWKISGGSIDGIYINLGDYNESAGTGKGHYFHQDLKVANEIFLNQPSKHLDIGSRIDGFVAHVASFMKITVGDVRPLEIKNHPNINFINLDMMASQKIDRFPSVSCLHALEHFGMGRYNDPINPRGSEEGFRNLCELVEEGGRLYVSHPISHSPKILFNAHRILPIDFTCKLIGSDFTLVKFFVIDDAGELYCLSIEDCMMNMQLNYGCGIYIYEKVNRVDG